MDIRARFKRKLLILLHDTAWVPISIFLAFWFRFNLSWIPGDQLKEVFEVVVVAVPVHAAVFWFFGCHRGIWQFFSIPDSLRLLRAVTVGTLLVVAGLVLYYRLGGVPRTVVVLYPILLFLNISALRMVYRMLKAHTFVPENSERISALVVGAGRAGDLLIRDLLEHGSFIPAAIVDDDVKKQGTDLHGVRVVGTLDDIETHVRGFGVHAVLIAMPSAPREVMDRVIKACAVLQIPCRTLPSLLELANGDVEVSRLRPVTVEDLLGREPVKLDEEAIKGYLEGKCIAITGGGGSIGSELCRQVLLHRPSKLVIIDSSEFNLYTIGSKLSIDFSDSKVVPVLADIRLAETIDYIFSVYRPDVIFHAAAYKHVPMLEEGINIVEGVRNNIFGTKTVADAAVKHDVSVFVQVSTDKTVNPTNIMGATKRIGEIYCQALNNEVGTQFITTRFGNVLGSAGSVVPLFESQIKEGGPVTVTHPDITRYFMDDTRGRVSDFAGRRNG